MAAQQNGESQKSVNPEADLAQAFKDLAKGERTATQIENQLAALERKIDEMLAQADKQEPQRNGATNSMSAPQVDAPEDGDKKP
ncbi:hypothetical protein NA57DRAFT_81940 [Rhizodiscina lignyota]|uniref:Uncharacterized protein n=1 Tax=Rhizodiscina lignyota TaxID=1504668 RepID=A0A9P4I658_9PEZI|nr:hypothetical protein NA57DRAFT_81940 [Rhizodiscina lignyota]